MILTPTYHVFDMFQVHQEGEALEVDFVSTPYERHGENIPQVSVSASRSSHELHISFCHLNPHERATLSLDIDGINSETKAFGKILTADWMNAHNTFHAPHTVEPAEFQQFSVTSGEMTIDLPPMSVVILTLHMTP